MLLLQCTPAARLISRLCADEKEIWFDLNEQLG